MSNLIFEHITLLFLAFLIGIAAGFIAKLLLRQRRQRREQVLPEERDAIEVAEADEEFDEPGFQPEEAVQAEDEAFEEDEFEYETEAFGLEEPRGGKSDNLTKISGIGRKTQELLNDLGVFHYDQIAGWSAVEVTAVDEMLPFRGQIERDNWVGQAKELAGIAPEADEETSEPEEQKG